MTAGASFEEAERFLRCLDPFAKSWTFQTLDDDRARNDPSLRRIVHGSLSTHFRALATGNAKGAGVFVMPALGDERGRKAGNVLAVRAVYVDLDGAPLEPVLAAESFQPHAVVATSEGKWHAYWRVADCPLKKFAGVQHALIRRFESDPSVNDLPRVMRLPGFLHQKDPSSPYAVKAIDLRNMPPYGLDELVAGLNLTIGAVDEKRPIAGIDDGATLSAGLRHDALIRYAGRLRAAGTNQDEILDALMAVNLRRCDPPKDIQELEQIAAYVGGKDYKGSDLAAPALDVHATLQRIENAAAIAATPFEPTVMEIEQLQPVADAPTLVFGAPGSLKSWIALGICDALVRGAPFLGFATNRRPSALYINVDAGEVTFRNRVRGFTDAPEIEILSIASAEFTPELLRALLERHRGGYVVLDCLSSIYSPDVKKDPTLAMRVFVDGLRAAYAEFGCGGLVVDHPHRPKERGEVGDYYGSVQKEAAFRSMWLVAAEPPDEDDKSIRRAKIVCRKMSEGAMFAPVDVEIEFGSRVHIRRASVAEISTRATLIEAKILVWGRQQLDAFSKRTVEDKVRGHRVSEVRRALEALIERGDVEPTGAKRGNGILFRVAGEASASASGTHSDAPDAPECECQNGVRPPIASPIGDALLGRTPGRTQNDETPFTAQSGTNEAWSAA